MAKDTVRYVCPVCQTHYRGYDGCPTCNDRYAKRELAVERARLCETIPIAFKWAKFNHHPFTQRVCDSEAIKKAIKTTDPLAKRSIKSVILDGPSGSGKTAIACAILHAIVWADQRVSIRFQRATDLSHTFGRYSRTNDDNHIELSKEANVLVIDDLGTENAQGTDCVRTIIHHRFDENRPTIYTTWMTPTEIEKRYGQGTTRRILQFGITIRVCKKNAPQPNVAPTN